MIIWFQYDCCTHDCCSTLWPDACWYLAWNWCSVVYCGNFAPMLILWAPQLGPSQCRLTDHSTIPPRFVNETGVGVWRWQHSSVRLPVVTVYWTTCLLVNILQSQIPRCDAESLSTCSTCHSLTHLFCDALVLRNASMTKLLSIAMSLRLGMLTRDFDLDLVILTVFICDCRRNTMRRCSVNQWSVRVCW